MLVSTLRQKVEIRGIIWEGREGRCLSTNDCIDDPKEYTQRAVRISEFGKIEKYIVNIRNTFSVLQVQP